MMSEIRVLGVLVETRSEAALKLQEVLTKYGCSIRTRLGIHGQNVAGCKNCGLIILELHGNVDECIRLENELWTMDGVKVQKIVF